MNALKRVLNGASKRLIVLIPAAMAAGFAYGLLADASLLKPWVLPLTVVMVYPMLVNFRPRAVLDGGDMRAFWMAMGLDFLVLPLVAWGFALAFFREQPALFAGMVLAGLFPTSGMTISWTGFAKGNVAAAVKMTVVGLIAASLLAPVYLKALVGAVVPVDAGEVLKTVALVVALPMAAGALTRIGVVRARGEAYFREQVVPALPGLSTIGVLGIVFVAIALKAKAIAAAPQALLVILAPLAAFYALNFVLATAVGKALLPRGDAIALVYGTVMRNLSIALGIAVTQFGPESALVLSLAYVVQVQAAAWYVRLTDRVFGPAEPVAAQPSSA
ncbi:MAG: hypothetical protein QMD96_03785 [Anaerosomatales bacterium]|nr:hypothetical protein [Anaerosomatales bacterium]